MDAVSDSGDGGTHQHQPIFSIRSEAAWCRIRGAISSRACSTMIRQSPSLVASSAFLQRGARLPQAHLPVASQLTELSLGAARVAPDVLRVVGLDVADDELLDCLLRLRPERILQLRHRLAYLTGSVLIKDLSGA